MGELQKALADYNAAFKLDPKLASSLYGRGIVEQKNDDIARAKADIAAAKSLNPGIDKEFANYGVK